MRYSSVDLLKFIAISTMVFCHSIMYVSAPSSHSVYILFVQGLGTLSAPLFAFLLGVNFRFSNKSNAQQLKRGVLLFVIGLLLDWAVFGSLYTWGILTFLGLSLCLMCLFRKLSDKDILLIAIGILVVSPLVRHYALYPVHWMNEFYQIRLGFIYNLKSIYANGIFPILPWFVFCLAGYLSVPILYGEKSKIKGMMSPLGKTQFALLGVTFVSVTVHFFIPHHWISRFLFEYPVFHPMTFPLATFLILFMIGLTKTMIKFDDKSAGKLMQSFLVVGRYSLSIYVIHILILLLPRRVEQWNEMYSLGAGLIAGFVVFGLCLLVAKVLSVRDGKFSLEWCLNKV